MRFFGESGGMTMQRLPSILIITGAVLAVAQAAVAQLAVVPITVTSQTLRVSGSSETTGDVVGGSSVGTSWSLSNEHGSSGGTVSSVLTNGEIVFTVDGAISRGGTGAPVNVNAAVSLDFTFEISVPDVGDATTPLYFQVSRTNSVFTGTAELNSFESELAWIGDIRHYTSVLFGGKVKIQEDTRVELPIADTLVTHDVFIAIPTDTITVTWHFGQNTRVLIDDSTGTYSETYNFRVVTPTPVPEPSAALSIPSGAGMLLVLAKLRGAGLGR